MATDYLLISSKIDFFHLRSEWTDLLHRSGISNPFLTWEWMFTWWEKYGDNNPSRELAIVLSRDNRTINSIFPGYITVYRFAGLPVRIFRIIGTEIESSDYQEFITPFPASFKHTTKLVQHLLANRRIDILRLIGLVSSSELRKSVTGNYLEKYLSIVNVHRNCPYLSLTGTYDDYIASLSKKLRYNIGWYNRKLVNKYNGELNLVTDAAEVEGAIDELFSLHEKRFLEKKVRSAFVKDKRGDFHSKVSRLFFEKDILRLFRIRIGGKTIAALYAFQVNENLFVYQTGMDPQWKKLSPLTVLWAYAIRYAFENKLKRFDFMRGAEAYKYRWTKTSRNILLADIGITQLGKLILKSIHFGSGIKRFLKWLIPDRVWELGKGVRRFGDKILS